MDDTAQWGDVVPVSDRRARGHRARGRLADNGVTVFDTIPSVLRSFAQTLRDERIPGVRLVRLASEGALHGDFETFRRHFPADCRLASALASSEAGIIAQALLDPGDDLAPGRLPVGRPAEGIDLRLVTEDGRRPSTVTRVRSSCRAVISHRAIGAMRRSPPSAS